MAQAAIKRLFMDKIISSVGRGSTNHSADVKIVQKLLNAQKIPDVTVPLKVDGKIGSKTYARIEAFQKKILKMVHPDGRVDPNGKTFKKLSASTNKLGAKAGNNFTFSQKGINLLKSIEVLATKPYDDQVGINKTITEWVKGATIGYGHLIAKSDWTKYRNGITKTEADTLFKTDLIPFVNTVKIKVTATITQNKFDAMVILAFNIGRNGFSSSSILKLVNNPNAPTRYPNLEAAWKAWNKSQGKVSKGLRNRRGAEWAIYSKNVYEKW